MAGVPFDILETLTTPKAAAAARAAIAAERRLSRITKELEDVLPSSRAPANRKQRRAMQKALRSGSAERLANLPGFERWRDELLSITEAIRSVHHTLADELTPARQHMRDTAHAVLPRYLVFVDPALRERMMKQSSGPVQLRNKDTRAHERHLLLYLQRICAKNDSLSEFGPEGWGIIDEGTAALTLKSVTGIAERETFLERWTAHGVAAAMNADPNVRIELAPRIHPNGRVEDERFVFCDTGETVALTAAQLDLLRQIDGRSPAYAIRGDVNDLDQLARENFIRWEAEVPALDPHAFDTLVSDVRGWRDNSARAYWLQLLEPIAELPRRFAKNSDTEARIQVMDEARAALGPLGVGRGGSDRFLYSAANPIGEECFRRTDFAINPALLGEVPEQAAPWIDLWRDCYAFVADRVAAGLRGLLASSPGKAGPIPLPMFIRHCASRKMPLTGPGLVGFAHLAFQEVKSTFREVFHDRAALELEEWEFTANDSEFVRRKFKYATFDEFTYPSADLQLAARSVESVARGEYQWVLAELHPPVAMLHHGFYWSCPDKKGLAEAFSLTTSNRPHFHFGFFAVDFTSATAVHLDEAVPGSFNFVAAQRGDPALRVISPAEAEVYIDESTQDVCLRRIDSGEHLGSFARAWYIPLGFHPFAFSLGAHTPRLRCGNVVVQRRAWVVRAEELGFGDFTGVSSQLMMAIERLRERKQWPRCVYVRPSEQALRRSGAEGRDKDTKPIFIDFESYLFHEIFYRWLVKAGELEVTEMLPDSDHLLWKESDGRRTFELRTLIVPRR
jgi:hypothetical protein